MDMYLQWWFLDSFIMKISQLQWNFIGFDVKVGNYPSIFVKRPFAKLPTLSGKKELCNRPGRFIAPVAYLLSAPHAFDLQTMQFSPGSRGE
jgi:hypothetical protein